MMDWDMDWEKVYEWFSEFFSEDEEIWEKRKFEEQNERLNEIFGGHGWYITEQP